MPQNKNKHHIFLFYCTRYIQDTFYILSETACESLKNIGIKRKKKKKENIYKEYKKQKPICHPVKFIESSVVGKGYIQKCKKKCNNNERKSILKKKERFACNESSLDHLNLIFKFIILFYNLNKNFTFFICQQIICVCYNVFWCKECLWKLKSVPLRYKNTPGL